MIKEIKLDLIPQIRKLEILSRRDLTGGLTGRYISAFKGRGLEFDGYNQYSVGEDAMSIDWKASLRSGDILVKKYIIERNLHIFFLFDVSNSMLFGSTKKMKAEYAAELIASLGFAILRAGDGVGIAMFSDEIVYNVQPFLGNKQYYTIIKNLQDPMLYGGSFNMGFGLRFVSNFLKKRAVVIIVSDFLGLEPGWDDHLKLAVSKFDIIPIIVRDPHDMTLPNIQKDILVEDPYSLDQRVINPSQMKAQYERLVKEYDDNVKKVFHDHRLDFIELTTDKPFATELMKFFKWREAKKPFG